MKERNGIITIDGKPVTLLGTEIKGGQKAPDFIVHNENFVKITLSSFLGKKCIVVGVISLEFRSCSNIVLKLDSYAQTLQDTEILIISMDLPYAMKRWKKTNEIHKALLFSDHREASFGLKFGILLKEMRVLATSTFILDRDGFIRHMQIPKDASDPLDFDLMVEAARNIP